MQIAMTQTTAGSSDGFIVEQFLEGQTYDTTKDIGGSLAWQFIQRGQAIVTQGVDDVMAELTGAAGAYRLDGEQALG